jgi:hypothetical protein
MNVVSFGKSMEPDFRCSALGGTALGAIAAVAAVAAALMFSTPAATEPAHNDGPVAIQVHAKTINLFLPAAGDLILTMVSDDNFSFLQRTILLQFKLIEE